MVVQAEFQELEAAIATACTLLFKCGAVATARSTPARLEWMGNYLLGRAAPARAEREPTPAAKWPTLSTVERNKIIRELERALAGACTEAIRQHRASDGSIRLDHRVGESLLQAARPDAWPPAAAETSMETDQLARVDSPVKRATSLAYVCEIWEKLLHQRRHSWVYACPPRA